jgi:hypothetical protein
VKTLRSQLEEERGILVYLSRAELTLISSHQIKETEFDIVVIAAWDTDHPTGAKNFDSWR